MYSYCMPTKPLLLDVLASLFQLARMGRPAHAGAIARRLGTTPSVAARALVRLEQLGLCDASRGRLTLRGLAVASSQAASPRATAHAAA
jgi:DNA-binding MarR family transcriptional regulator